MLPVFVNIVVASTHAALLDCSATDRSGFKPDLIIQVPVSDCSGTPPLRVALFSQLIYLFPVFHERCRFSPVPLTRREEFQTTVPVFFVVPLRKTMNPIAGSPKVSKWLTWITRPILQGSENGFSKRVVITYPWRLNELTTPRRCSVDSIVPPFMALPLSECKTSGLSIAAIP